MMLHNHDERGASNRTKRRAKLTNIRTMCAARHNRRALLKASRNLDRLFQFFYRGREWGREQGSTPWASSSEALRSRQPLLLQNLNTVALLTFFPVFSLKRSVISSHVYSPSSSSDNSASTVSSASVNTLGLPDLGSAAALPVSRCLFIMS